MKREKIDALETICAMLIIFGMAIVLPLFLLIHNILVIGG